MQRTPINLNHRFHPAQREKIRPAVTSLHSYPKAAGVLSNKITSRGWAIEYHWKDAGRIFLQSLDNPLARAPRSVHLYAPGSIYWEDTSTAASPLQETYLFFTGAKICGLSRLVSPQLGLARFHDPEALVGNLFATALLACSTTGEDSFWIVQSVFMKMIDQFIRSRPLNNYHYSLLPDATPLRANTFSREVEEYLRSHTERNLSLAEIAAAMKTSESLLSHKFKNETGISPVARHAELRIEFAKNLILKGEKLKNIAVMTGYSDEYHFSKSFKASTGLPPRAFKQSHRYS